MPLFEPDSLRALVGDRANGEHTLDLRGISLSKARSAISQMLERSPSDDVTSVVIRIDPATATSGETLFLPIGRQLLEARRRGLVTPSTTSPISAMRARPSSSTFSIAC